MSIIGTKYIGAGYASPDGYADLNAAFTAIGSAMVGSVELVVATDVVDPPKAILSGTNFNGYTLKITFLTEHEGIARNPFQYLMDTADEAMEFNDCNYGNLIIEKANIRHLTDVTTSVNKRTIAFTGTTNLSVLIHDTILQGGRKGQTALYIGSSIDLDAYNLTFSRYKNPAVENEGRAIEITIGGSLRFENCTIHDCGSALTALYSQPVYIANSYFADNDTDFTPTGGGSNVVTSKNNGRSGSGLFGFTTETDTRDNLLSSAEFFSTDFESFNYLRLKPSAVAAESGLGYGFLLIPGNNHGIRLNNRGLNGTTSIGSDEAVRYAKSRLRNVPPQAGGNATAGNRMGESLTKQIPDRGENFSETRFLILDHGRDSDTDPTPRDPEWVDMTEFAGLYRLQKVPDIINVGTEGVRPYRFKASSLTLKAINTDFAWDNLKKIDLTTIDGNPAKFMLTENETNLDLKFRPAKFVAKFPKENMTVSYELGHFRIDTIDTDSSGSASIRLNSLEKDFIEKSAATVKNGKNWFFDKSVKFLVEELIKEVRNEYKDNKEVVVGQDTISLSGIETADNQRAYSEFGRPDVTVKPNDGVLTKGEKTLVTTAAAPRCIFRGTLNNDISVGSNFIQMKFDDPIDIKKGDVLTLGYETPQGSPASMNEEKVVVLEDISFSGTVDEVLNIRVSSLKKNHYSGEIIERWIVYLGCTNGIESQDESYLVAFDPDRDEYAVMIDSTNLGGSTVAHLKYPFRFLNIQQTLRSNKIPGPDVEGFPSGSGQTLMGCTAVYSFPGSPNENGEIIMWFIDTTKRWDEIHLTAFASSDATKKFGGVYTGQHSFRSAKPMLTQADMQIVSDTDLSPRFFGSHGVGKFVEEVMAINGARLFGFGYIAGLAADLNSSDSSVTVAIPANSAEWWAVSPIEIGGENIYGGTIYVIGATEEKVGQKEGIGETFGSENIFFSARITSVVRPALNQIRYSFEESPNALFSIASSVVVVIPDSGKMYVGNCGENTGINEAQDLNVAEWLGDDEEKESVALDSSETEPVIYNDTVAHEKKQSIDRAKPLNIIKKRKISAKSVDPAYYSSIIEKRHLKVNAGDILSVNDDSSINFRIVPGQYTGVPFAPELHRVYYPESPIAVDSQGRSYIRFNDTLSRATIGDRPPIVYDVLNDGSVDINGNQSFITHPFMRSMFVKFLDGTGMHNRNLHSWNFPIIGLWEKFDGLNKSLLSFDGSIIADNGNSELLGYWYLAYENYPEVEDRDDIPRLDLAYVDDEGIVHVVKPEEVPDDHFPVCSVLHNLTYHNGGPGTVSLDFYGNLSEEMRSRLEYILGGTFQAIGNLQNGDPLVYDPIYGPPIYYKYMRWDPGITQFTRQYPIDMNAMPTNPYEGKIVLKFKKIKNPQAEGSLFVGLHCYPVRIRHLHLPFGEEAFEDGSEISIECDGKRQDAKPPLSREFSYPAKIVDSNFVLGSEELLNQDPDTKEFNLWVIDRYSQNKSLGMFMGVGDDYASGGLLKGVSLNDSKIEIPIGYKGKVPASVSQEVEVQLTKDDDAYTFGFGSGGILGSYNPGQFAIGIDVNPGFRQEDIGTFVKIDGLFDYSKYPPSLPTLVTAEYSEFLHYMLDGIYEIEDLIDVGGVVLYLKVPRENDRRGLATGLTSSIIESWAPFAANICTIKRYYGTDLEYSNTVVRDVVHAFEGTYLLREENGGTRKAINTGDAYSYDIKAGLLNYSQEVAPDKLSFSWDLVGTNPASLDFLTYWELEKTSGSGPDKMTFSTVDFIGESTKFPKFQRQDIEHRDHLFGQAAPSSDFPLTFNTTFLSYYKIVFGCRPSFGNIVNYPAALYGRSWGKFWKYYERRSNESTKEIRRKTAFAYVVPRDTFGGLVYSDVPFEISFRNPIKDAEFSYSNDDRIDWNKWLSTVAVAINGSSGELSAETVRMPGRKYDALYLFNNGPDYGEPDLTLQVVGIEQGTPGVLTFINAPSDLRDVIDVDDVFYMYNNHGDNAHSYLKVTVVEQYNITAESYTTYDPTTGLDNVRDFRKEENKETRITRIAGINFSLYKYIHSYVRTTSVDDTGAYRDRYGDIDVVMVEGSSVGNIISLKEGKNYGAGDGVFDSGIKPLEFGDTFVNSMAKWYLSRFDSVDPETGDKKILANTYTLNHDAPFLGDDAKLYSIVYYHPSYPAISRFPFIKFSTGAQSNFKASQLPDKDLYFARAKFVDVGNELQIQYWAARLRGSTGYVENFSIFPGSYTGRNNFESELKSDFEIHGIFNNENGTISCGVMKWANKGNVNKEWLTNETTSYLAQSRYFSDNLLADSQDGGSTWNFNYLTNAIGGSPSILFGSLDPNDFEHLTSPISRYVINVWEIPLQVKCGGIIQTYVTASLPNYGEWTYHWNGVNWTVAIGQNILGAVEFGFANVAYTLYNDYKGLRYGAEGFHPSLFMIKSWTDTPHNYIMLGQNKKALRGIIMKRHDINSDDQIARDKREDLIVFHTEESLGGFSYFKGRSSTLYPYALTSIREFSFRNSDDDGYYFTNNFDNTMSKWNGDAYSPVVYEVSPNNPTVEGDFNQYFPMVKISSAYEELFGFSMGSKAHASSQSFKGGRNIIWKFSKSLSFHISVADFEGLSVWDALGNFAELTDCVVGFDRFGNLHFEPRPIVDENTSFFFTFDNIDEQNLISIKKKSAYQHIYNEIEIVPYRPELPAIQSNLVSQSDLNTVSVNSDLFIRDQSLDFAEKSPDKARPDIKAFQKDFKRKRILLVCTNGQFNSDNSEARGLFSRFKYQMIEDLIELRLAEDLEAGRSGMYVNRIPFDSQTDSAAFSSGDKLFLGADEYEVLSIFPETNSITFTPSIPSGKRYEAGTPIVISSRDQEDKRFFAEGSGVHAVTDGSLITTSGYTFSPKTWFVEIGEWSFKDDPAMKKKTELTANVGPSSTIITVKSTQGFPNEGTLSVAGTRVTYSAISSTGFLVSSPILFDVSAGIPIYLMPDAPILYGDTGNPRYNPNLWLLGGPDELGSACLDEYHLFDPNEDGQPYFDAAPAIGGKPITALEFYSKNQKTITYYDSVNAKNNNLPDIMSNTYGVGYDYRARHRTHVSMKIAFNGFRFSDGDRIELDVPGIKLAPQQHLTKIFSNHNSINKSGLRQYPATNNRFFNNSSASVVGKRILDRVSRIDEEVEVVGYISDINDLNWLSTVRVIDNRLFGSYPSNQAIGYVKSLKFNQNSGTVTVTMITRQT